MGESEELFSAINYVKNKVDAIEGIELLNLRSNKALYEEYVELLRSDSLLLQVYKEIDGIKAQKEIASAVDTTGKTVSIKIKKLSELGLIELKDAANGKRVYKHSVAEKAFKLTRL